MSNEFIYNLVRYIINEEESGNALSPSDFNNLLKTCSAEMTRQVFRQYEEGQEVTDALQRFKKTPSSFSFASGKADLPNDYFRKSYLICGDAWAEFCSDYEFGIRQSGEIPFKDYIRLIERYFEGVEQQREESKQEGESPKEHEIETLSRIASTPEEKNIVDTLRKFKKVAELSGNGSSVNFALPDDYYKGLYVLTDTEAWVEILDDREFALRQATTIPFEYFVALSQKFFMGYEEGQEVTDAIRRFKKTSDISIVAGAGVLPTDYFRKAYALAGDAWVDFCTDYEFGIRGAKEIPFKDYLTLLEKYFDNVVEQEQQSEPKTDRPKEGDKDKEVGSQSAITPAEKDIIDVLRKFKKEDEIAIAAGEVTLPDDYYRRLYMTVGDKWVEFLDDREYGLRESETLPFEYFVALSEKFFSNYEEGQEVTDAIQRFKQSTTLEFRDESGTFANRGTHAGEAIGFRYYATDTDQYFVKTTAGDVWEEKDSAQVDLPSDYFRKSYLHIGKAWTDFCTDYEFGIRQAEEIPFKDYLNLLDKYFEDVPQQKQIAKNTTDRPKEGAEEKQEQKVLEARGKDIIDVLRKFKKTSTVNLTTGEGDLPSDYYKSIFLTAADAWVELVSDQEFGLRGSDKIPFDYFMALSEKYFFHYEEGQEITDSIKKYKKSVTLDFSTGTAGEAALPADYFRNAYMLADGRWVDFCTDAEFGERQGKALTAPTVRNPIARIVGDNIEILPTSITSANFHYLCRPDTPSEEEPIARVTGDELHVLPTSTSEVELHYLAKPDLPTEDRPIAKIADGYLVVAPKSVSEGIFYYLARPDTPSEDYPVAKIVDGKIVISGVSTGDAVLHYLRKPDTPTVDTPIAKIIGDEIHVLPATIGTVELHYLARPDTPTEDHPVAKVMGDELIIEPEDVTDVELHYLAKPDLPTVDRPIARIAGGKIEILPDTITAGEFHYLREPLEPFFDYYFDANDRLVAFPDGTHTLGANEIGREGQTTGDITSEDVPLDWENNEKLVIVGMICSKAGANLKEGQVIEYSELLKNQQS